MKLLPPPGPARRNQIVLLIFALVALVGVGWYEFAPEAAPTQAGAPLIASNQRAATTAAPPQAASAGPAMPEALELDALEPVPSEPRSGRNPFRFGVPPPPPPPPAPPPMPVVQLPPPEPPGPPPIPPIQLKFNTLYVLPDGRRMAQLTDLQGARFSAFEGQVVGGQYRVVRIGLESLIIEYVDGTGRRTIPMG